MKKNLFSLVAIVLAFVFLMGTISVSATENSNKTESKTSFNKMCQIADVSVEVIDSERIVEVKELVKDYIDAGNTVFHFESAYLDYDDAKLLNIVCENDIYTSITIPVVGNLYSIISSTTFVLLENQIVIYSESLVTTGEDNKFVIDTYYDGTLVESNHTDIEYISDDEIQDSLNTIHESVQKVNDYAQSRGAGAIAGCLVGVLGVNAAVAYLIAATCIASCPAVVPICVACIAGVCTIGAADVAAVVACFGL